MREAAPTLGKATVRCGPTACLPTERSFCAHAQGDFDDNPGWFAAFLFGHLFSSVVLFLFSMLVFFSAPRSAATHAAFVFVLDFLLVVFLSPSRFLPLCPSSRGRHSAQSFLPSLCTSCGRVSLFSCGCGCTSPSFFLLLSGSDSFLTRWARAMRCCFVCKCS